MRQELKILLIEDDPSFRASVKELLGVYNEIDEAGDLVSARRALGTKEYDVVILDKFLPDGSGVSLIPEIKTESPRAVTIILTADNDFNAVGKCLAAGADDYVFKSSNAIPDLLVRIPLAIGRAAAERRSSYLETLNREAFKFEIVGKSPEMTELRGMVHSMKWSRAPVLISGESGTGKELIARRLHAIEDDKGRQFISINCGAIPENLFESELFGHKKGAFTGALSDKIGKLELANGGDLFLDEIGELPLSMQVKLLRVLQENEFSRIGCNKVIKADFRVIAATNRPLEDLVRQQKFRADLYYRLNVVQIKTVPLRERIGDVVDLARFFVVQLSGGRADISDAAVKWLSQHDWPGNVRELRNTIERALLTAKRRGTGMIDAEDITLDRMAIDLSGHLRNVGMLLPSARNEIVVGSYEKFMDTAEKEYLKSVLQLCGGNASDAADLIGMGRSTMFKKLGLHGLIRRDSARNSAQQNKNEGSIHG